ncbi:MAG: hypoxanthine phosphoribosyltransferase, partial [Candidatus Eremiobacteraeota bacterium]|nr:hypoxanthine phosphoribosyltransferase [Candidatus Eremiobacteraeota bacterium]
MTKALPPELTRVLLPEEQIQQRIRELGEAVSRDYQNEELVLLCVLKGSLLFTSDLMRHLDLRVTVDFIGISSYGESTRSSGVVRIV